MCSHVHGAPAVPRPVAVRLLNPQHTEVLREPASTYDHMHPHAPSVLSPVTDLLMFLPRRYHLPNPSFLQPRL